MEDLILRLKEAAEYGKKHAATIKAERQNTNPNSEDMQTLQFERGKFDSLRNQLDALIVQMCTYNDTRIF